MTRFQVRSALFVFVFLAAISLAIGSLPIRPIQTYRGPIPAAHLRDHKPAINRRATVKLRSGYVRSINAAN